MNTDLNVSNILLEEEIEDLFSVKDDTTNSDNDNIQEGLEESSSETKPQNKTTEVNTETLFSDVPESVSSEDNSQGEGENPKSDEADSSPKSTSAYSSIAAALKDEGILPDLDDETINGIDTPEAFSEAIHQQIKNQLTERQQRIDDALSVGITPPEIKQFENTLTYLDQISDESIEAETDDGENVRKQLIYQDFINRGFTKERAIKEVEKSFNAGTDVDDAKEALSGNKEFFKSLYDSKINDGKKLVEKQKAQLEKDLAALKKQILETEEPFQGVKLTKPMREKVYNVISKPVYKDDNGVYYTELQKYEKENKQKFLHNVGLLYTLTDGFKNLDTLVKGEVTKKTGSKIKELSHVLNNTARNSDGSLKFVTGVSDDKNANINFELDI